MPGSLMEVKGIKEEFGIRWAGQRAGWKETEWKEKSGVKTGACSPDSSLAPRWGCCFRGLSYP